jgi:hypothetical protein
MISTAFGSIFNASVPWVPSGFAQRSRPNSIGVQDRPKLADPAKGIMHKKCTLTPVLFYEAAIRAVLTRPI